MKYFCGLWAASASTSSTRASATGSCTSRRRVWAGSTTCASPSSRTRSQEGAYRTANVVYCTVEALTVVSNAVASRSPPMPYADTHVRRPTTRRRQQSRRCTLSRAAAHVAAAYVSMHVPDARSERTHCSACRARPTSVCSTTLTHMDDHLSAHSCYSTSTGVYGPTDMTPHRQTGGYGFNLPYAYRVYA